MSGGSFEPPEQSIALPLVQPVKTEDQTLMTPTPCIIVIIILDKLY